MSDYPLSRPFTRPLSPRLALAADRSLRAEQRARAFRYAREFIAWYAENGASRWCHLHPGTWYAVVPIDRSSLLRDARSNGLTILVDGTDAEDLASTLTEA